MIMIKHIFLIMGMLCPGLPVTAQVTETFVAENLSSSTIIVGGFGTNKGEFGAIDPNEAEALGIVHYPVSLVVDSKGNIYILDIFNNRIQEFDVKGRFISVIPVIALTDENGDSAVDVNTRTNGHKSINVKKAFMSSEAHSKASFVRGINIVIDSNDNLYYYSAKKDGGEVVQFQNGALRAKWSVPVADKTGIQVDENNELWVGNYNATKRKQAARNASTLKFQDGRVLTLDKKSDEVSLRFSKGGKYKLQKLKGEHAGGHWVSNNVKEMPAGKTVVNWGYFDKGGRHAFLDVYTEDGELVSRDKLPVEINLRWNPVGPDGAIYQIIYGDANLKVIKWARGANK